MVLGSSWPITTGGGRQDNGSAEEFRQGVFNDRIVCTWLMEIIQVSDASKVYKPPLLVQNKGEAINDI